MERDNKYVKPVASIPQISN